MLELESAVFSAVPLRRIRYSNAPAASAVPLTCCSSERHGASPLAAGSAFKRVIRLSEGKKSHCDSARVRDEGLCASAFRNLYEIPVPYRLPMPGYFSHVLGNKTVPE